jgi:uncharacterized protein
MTDQLTHYLSPKLALKSEPSKGALGIFAMQPVQAGETLTVWGGRVVDFEHLQELSEFEITHSIQVEDDLHLLPLREGEPADYFNHSCDPNAGLSGQIVLVALRDIAVGEEVCFDYAMSDSNAYDEFTCGCGAATCRGRVTGNDWRSPELWERYAGHFSPYLQRRIDRLKAGSDERS